MSIHSIQRFIWITAFSFCAVFASQTQAEDIDKGKLVFRRCVACHYADQAGNKVGPTLLNVMGRTAGSLDGYRFSPAMVEAGKNGLIWDRESLIQYLHDPRGMIKGTRMASVKIKDDQEIDDLIAYLKSVSAP